ncbi:MAG: hypothetical protein ACRD7E_02655 [Bryobacteraceae bacterium]
MAKVINWTNRLAGLLRELPPDHAFEISEAGIAYVRPGVSPETRFQPLENDVLSVSPLRDNVLRPEALAAAVKSLVTGTVSRKRNKAVVILPDYCARVAVLEFDAFPADPKEQLSLVRFRMKKSVPFDVDSAAIAYHPQPAAVQQPAGASKKLDVLVVVAALEIVGRYEAPFRAAGLQPGVVTTSVLAAADLDLSRGISVLAKLSGRVLTVAVLHSGVLKLVRCVELSVVTPEEIVAVLFPTVAYVEDEHAARPDRLLLCGLGALGEENSPAWESDLGLPVEPLRSKFGVPGEYNAGLLGYLQSLGGVPREGKRAS